MIVVFPERASNARRHAGNDDADVIGIVRVILRDGGEDVGSGGIQLHQVAWDRRILRVLPVQSCLGLFLEARQHDPVRLVARRVVDALKVADDVGVLADHPLLVLFRQGIPPGCIFLWRCIRGR